MCRAQRVALHALTIILSGALGAGSAIAQPTGPANPASVPAQGSGNTSTGAQGGAGRSTAPSDQAARVPDLCLDRPDLQQCKKTEPPKQ
jgi:hypothetical protein